MNRVLNCEVLLRIGEEKSTDTISKFLYDADGKECGEKNIEQYEAELEAAKGKRVLFVDAICAGKSAKYQSPHVDNDDIHVANALANVLATLSGSIVKQFRSSPKERSKIIQLNGN